MKIDMLGVVGNQSWLVLSVFPVPLRPLACFDCRVAIREKTETTITVYTQPADTTIDLVHKSTVDRRR